MSKKIRSYWENNFNRKDKKSQVLVIENERVQIGDILNDIDKLVIRLTKKNPRLTGKDEEVKDILEKFLIEICSSRELIGTIE